MWLSSWLACAGGGITPQPFPGPEVTGIDFPVPPERIERWRANADEAEMAKHAWGLWAGVHHVTDEVWGGQRLRVYETWQRPSDLTCGPDAGRCRLEPQPLLSPGQLEGSTRPSRRVTVAYDPVAFDHLEKEKLADPATLAALPVRGQFAAIPRFPDDAIVLKLVHELVPAGQRYLRLAVWSGPDERPEGYPESHWPTCVWVDLDDERTPTAPLEVLEDLDACHAPELEEQPLDERYVVPRGAFQSLTLPATLEAPETTALLVATHLTTRETDSWTWQTWWWTPEPDAPPAPSSEALATLQGPEAQVPRQYAMCVANQMLVPDQPFVGGDPDGGAPVVCYNPYLEAQLTNDGVPRNLPASEPFTYAGETWDLSLGIHTNCMSCHLLASHDGTSTVPTSADDGVGTAARYVDAEDPRLRGLVTLDTLFTVGQVADANAATRD